MRQLETPLESGRVARGEKAGAEITAVISHFWAAALPEETQQRQHTPNYSPFIKKKTGAVRQGDR